MNASSPGGRRDSRTGPEYSVASDPGTPSQYEIAPHAATNIGLSAVPDVAPDVAPDVEPDAGPDAGPAVAHDSGTSGLYGGLSASGGALSASSQKDRPLRFIHAADLHLDAAFRGLSSEVPESVRTVLSKATFTAFSRLVDLGCALRPDFVLLAGDIHNFEEGSLKARLALRDGCERLAKAGVPVFIAHGNHDPLSRQSASIRLPDNVTVFRADTPEFFAISPPDAPAAVVHGVSHWTDKERRSLARKFSRSLHDAFQIGVLHCTLDAVAASDVYAPATMRELRESGLDYWALGHIHQPQVVSRGPYVVYPGSPQGLHINEGGAHGCVVAEVSRDGAVSLAYQQLASVVWLTEEVDIARYETEDALDNALNEIAAAAADRCRYAEEDRAGADGREGQAESSEMEAHAGLPWLRGADGERMPVPEVEGVVLRLRLRGRGVLDATLRKPGAADTLLERLRETWAQERPFVWIKDMELACRPAHDLEALRRRSDLLGEALRVAASLRGEPGMEAAQPALEALFGKARLRKAVEPPDAEEMAALLEEAELLCMDMLEVE